MAKSLQEQLLNSGLVKGKKAKAKRRVEQHAARGVPSAETEEARRRAQEEKEKKVARDRALNQEKKAQAERKAIAAQIVQLIQAHQVEAKGEVAYQFTDGKRIKKIYVNGKIQQQLIRGVLAVVREPDDKNERYYLVPRAVAEKIAQRDESLVIVLNTSAPEQDDEDDPYADFKVPDDLMW